MLRASEILKMKFECIVFFIVCIAIVKPYTFKKIENAQGNIQFIEFGGNDDPDIDNVFVGGNHASGAVIYKLNWKRKDMIMKEEVELKNIQRIFTYSNNAYIFDASSIVSNGGSLFLLRYNSPKIEKLFEFPLDKNQPHVYFQTPDGRDIYFNTATGVARLRTRNYEERGLTVPKSIENLEYFSITSYETFGISDNEICLVGTFKGDPNPRIAIIWKSEQKKEFPFANVVNISNPNLNLITAVGTDADHKQTLIAFSGSIARIFKVKPYEEFEVDRQSYKFKTALEPVFGEYLQYFASFYSTSHIFYFFASNLFTGDCYLNYAGTSFDQYTFSAIPNLNFIGADNDCEHVTFTSDSKENIFFTMKKKNVFSLKLYQGTDEIQEIIFPPDKPEHDVKSLLVDKDDRLWILAGHLFMVPKDELKAQQITNYSFAVQSGIMKIHPKTNEIFIGSENGLHVYSD